MPVTNDFAHCKHTSKGFTLIELIVGIMLMSIALVVVTSVLMPQLRKGIDPIWQVRSVTLAQSLLSEISSKAFDESSITNTGWVACNHVVDCSTAQNLGSDTGESRAVFDDVDDFNGLTLQGVQIINAHGESFDASVADLFLGFSASVSVYYDDNSDGINDADTNNDGNLDQPGLVGNQKLIKVVVTTPEGENLSFTTYRANY